jgi:hypothetical protein
MFIKVDDSGIVYWGVTDEHEPYYWGLEQCFADGTSSVNTLFVTADITSYDAYKNGLYGGYNYKVWGLDKNYNVIIDPTISVEKSIFQ